MHHPRLWTVDALRGIAVIMMIIFHFFYALHILRGLPLPFNDVLWLIFGRATTVAFLLLVGLSLTISYHHVSKKSSSFITKKYLRRGAKTFVLGLIITIISFLLLERGFVFFGILHLIGVSIVLARPLLSKKYISLVLGLVVIALGMLLSTLTFTFSTLSWLGFQPADLFAFDYTPILPWFGIVLLGLFAGNALKIHNRKPTAAPNILAKTVSFIGRHSLLIYFLHQPILIGIILLI